MSFESRLAAIEQAVRIKTEVFGPSVVIIEVGEDKEAKLAALSQKYGKDYTPCFVVIREELEDQPQIVEEVLA